MPARCTGSGSDYVHCPGGELAHGNADPTLCDGAPVYQKGGAGGGGPVLFRIWVNSLGTQWYVTSDADSALARCTTTAVGDSSFRNYLQSRPNPQPLGSAPTAPAYSADGTWFEANTFAYSPIRVTAGGGR